MKKKGKHVGKISNRTWTEQAEARTEQAMTRTEQAKTRTELAETRAEQAETRAELAETRAEQAETRTELAKTRTEQAESRTQQAEVSLQRLVHKEPDLPHERSIPLPDEAPLQAAAGRKCLLEKLTRRQREILRLIAEGHNTKTIAEILTVSPKTIDYHRMKLMTGLNVHDIAGLVRFALAVGLIPPET